MYVRGQGYSLRGEMDRGRSLAVYSHPRAARIMLLDHMVGSL